MPEATITIDEAKPAGGAIIFKVPKLRQGDIEEGTTTLTIDGEAVAEDEVEFRVDFTYQTILATHITGSDWPAGGVATVAWQGYFLQELVESHEAKIVALEAAVAALQKERTS